MGKKYIKSIILYAVRGIVCFFNIRQLWAFALIFLGLTVFYVWLAYRHWNDEPDMSDRLKETAKRGILNGIMQSGKDRQERKEQYQAYLSDIEDEFDMSDYEDDYEDSED